jgi:predicted nuclease with TOPRIM domain
MLTDCLIATLVGISSVVPTAKIQSAHTKAEGSIGRLIATDPREPNDQKTAQLKPGLQKTCTYVHTGSEQGIVNKLHDIYL